MLSLPGLEWDMETNKFTASDGVWEKLIHVNGFHYDKEQKSLPDNEILKWFSLEGGWVLLAVFQYW